MSPATTVTTKVTAKSKRRITRRPCTSPEVGSLHDILHDHAGVSLYALPICWTDLHAQLLRCKFVHLPPQRSPVPSTSSSPRRQPQTPPTVVNLRKNLNDLIDMVESRPVHARNRAVRETMAALFPDRLSRTRTFADLSLRFGNRCYTKAARAQLVWKDPDSSHLSFDSATTLSNRSASQLMATMSVGPNAVRDTPLLAYISRSQLNFVRRNCFRVVGGPTGYNGPVHRLQTKRSKNLMPSNLDEDQYILAAMIAIAQESVYGDATQFDTTVNLRDVRVKLMTIAEESESFIIYTATIPAASLAMFHEPFKAPQGDPTIKVEYQHVPVWPVLGLKERLGQAIGKDVVGDFDEVNYETWEDELVSMASATPSPKRKREALSEVFNASFSEDRELPAETSDSIVKRRCFEEGRIGVVR